MGRPPKEFVAFRDLTDRLLTVSKETVDRRIAAYEAEQSRKPRHLRPGRNPKSDPGSIVSDGDHEDV
jgi:hypothetical protein